MNRFVAISYSPWSEKARWALDLRRVPYREEAYLPMLGELGLRVALRRFTGRVTVPVLFTDDGRALTDSFAIARFADETAKGAVLFPAGSDAEVARWNDRSEEILRAGRALSVAKAMENPAAQDESVPRLVPGPLRAMVGRSGVAWLRAKYGLVFDRAAAAATIAAGLRELRAALGGRRYLVGEAISHADVAMAISLQLVAPVAQEYVRLGRATRAVCTDAPIVEEFADIVAWRDALYAEYRRPR